MMSSLHDIYDPPPAPVPLAPPCPDPIAWKASDVAVLAALIALAVAASAWAWTVEPTLAVVVMIGGAVVIVESWSTALTFLHRRPLMSAQRPLARSTSPRSSPGSSPSDWRPP